MSLRLQFQLAVAGAIALALLAVPAPLLPPHHLAERIQKSFGINWHTAYFIAAIGLRACFYGSLGAFSALAVTKSSTIPGRLREFVIVPCLIAAAAIFIRSIKAGYPPAWINAVIPVIFCLMGFFLGRGFAHRRAASTMLLMVLAIGVSLWGLLSSAAPGLSRSTQERLSRLISTAPGLPPGEARFGALLQAALARPRTDAANSSSNPSEVENNRAGILALGMVIGHERLARFVGLPAHGEWISSVEVLRQSTPLRGDINLARHFCLSAALAVLEHPVISDAGGLLKELADFQKAGSGFSFNDLAANRAGVRFAIAAAQSETAAKAMQERLRKGFVLDDFFPPVADLPANLTMEQFHHEFGGVGGPRYRELIAEIEARLDRCAALSVAPNNSYHR